HCDNSGEPGWIFFGAEEPGAGNGDEQPGRTHRSGEPARAPADPERQGRTRTAGSFVQRIAGARGSIVRTAAAVYVRRVARIAHAGGDSERRIGSGAIADGALG